MASKQSVSTPFADQIVGMVQEDVRRIQDLERQAKKHAELAMEMSAKALSAKAAFTKKWHGFTFEQATGEESAKTSKKPRSARATKGKKLQTKAPELSATDRPAKANGAKKASGKKPYPFKTVESPLKLSILQAIRHFADDNTASKATPTAIAGRIETLIPELMAQYSKNAIHSALRDLRKGGHVAFKDPSRKHVKFQSEYLITESGRKILADDEAKS